MNKLLENIKDIKDKFEEILVGAGFDTLKNNWKKSSQDEKELSIVNIDPINKGPYIRKS